MASSLSPGSLNPAILNVQYAVRGELAIKAEEYRDKLKAQPNDHGLPFSKVTTANIGNPQQAGLDQKPLTFGRQVCFVGSIGVFGALTHCGVCVWPGWIGLDWIGRLLRCWSIRS